MRSARSTFFSNRSDRSAVARRFAVLVLFSGLAACTAARPSQPAAAGPRALSADSLAILHRAIALARPAYATQHEALRTGAYAAATPVPVGPPPVVAAAAARNPAAREVSQQSRSLFVIQISAHTDAWAAESAAAVARGVFPDTEVRVEQAGELLRVSIGAWPSQARARDTLPAVRQRYPDAWVRHAVP